MTIPEHLDGEVPIKTATTDAVPSRLAERGGTTGGPGPIAARPNSTPCFGKQYPPDCLRNRAWLQEQYVERRLGTHAIGGMVGRSPGTVAHHLKKHSIPLRDRREAARRTPSAVAYP